MLIITDDDNNDDDIIIMVIMIINWINEWAWWILKICFDSNFFLNSKG